MEGTKDETNGEAQEEVEVKKEKINMKNANEVYLAFLEEIRKGKALMLSFKTRFFGTSTSYKKQFGLPDDAPTKKHLTSCAANFTRLAEDATRRYNEVSRGNKERYNKHGELITTVSSRTNQSRMVLCSEKLTAAMALSSWDLISNFDAKRGHATHAIVTGWAANQIKLHVLQSTTEPKFWSTDKFFDDIFGENYQEAKLDKTKMTFPKLQTALKYHLKTVPKDSYEASVEAEIRKKCSADFEGGLGQAVATVKKYRDEMKTAQEDYQKHIKSRNHAQESRPTQEITKTWAEEVEKDVKRYNEAAANVKKAAQTFGFSCAPNYPPPIEDILKRAPPKPKAPKEKKAPPAKKAAAKKATGKAKK